MQVQSPENIRKDANLTPYRMAKMLGITQKNYKDIAEGKTKIPSGKVIANLILIAVNYADWSVERALSEVCADFGIDESAMKIRYNDNKKVEYKNK